ncbi:MAG TPA: SDR family oxidoreductase [Rubrobacteraceae bacterium]|nr:SDR family oxidoreductase [Rubrobacteraceae bacterium]
MRLENKVTVVTGSSLGIGRAIALAFAREGASVTVDYRKHSDEAEAVVKEVEELGGRALAVQADVSVPEDIRRLVQSAVDEFGRLDVMVNNAGIEEKMPFLETPLDVWNRILSVNLTGAWLGCQEAAKQMVAGGGGGRIINVSSVHEDRPMPTNAPYCAAKGGVRMLMRTIAVELAPHGITVNNIAPGAIETPINENLDEHPEQKEELLSEIPLGRIGKPEEVANLALYLASDEASYVTGSTFTIDGGMMRHAGSL